MSRAVTYRTVVQMYIQVRVKIPEEIVCITTVIVLASLSVFTVRRRSRK